MAWNYRKRIKLIPGVYLNVSKSGVSTTIGPRGANINLGKNGTYLNTGIPGTGIYSRSKFGGSSQNLESEILNDFKPDNPTQIIEPAIHSQRKYGEIFSKDPEDISSQDMQGVKETILSARSQRLTLKSDLNDIQLRLRKDKTRLKLSHILLYGFIFKKWAEGLKDDITAQTEALTQIMDELEKSIIQLDFEFDEQMKKQFNETQKTFKELMTSEKKWDIVTAVSSDPKITRSSASISVSRHETNINFKPLEDIRSNITPLYFHNINGADVYIYPNFAIMFESLTKFAVVALNELQINFSVTNFVETEKVPADAVLLRHTWKYVNKNGQPDKRFKDNYQIPVMEYGNLAFKTETGVNEEFEFSNCSATQQFSQSFNEFKNNLT